MISLKHITKQFGQKKILNDINLEIPSGQVVAIIGPSGGGKSTLLRCINYLEVPDQGEILIQQVPLHAGSMQVVCRQIGMVFQLFHLFEHLCVLDNVTYAPIKVLKQNPALARQEGIELLTKVGLADKISSYPRALSGGQKQRAAIARALAMKPKIMLFDEPTSALDPEMVKEVLDVIRGLLHTGLTVVMVTHEMGFARELSDRILFLDQGMIIEDAPPTTFFANPQHPRAQQFLRNIL